MMLFGANITQKHICMEKNEKKYVVTFHEDIFGNIKDVAFLIDGNYVDDGKLHTTPNIFGRIKEIVRLIRLNLFKRKKMIKNEFDQKKNTKIT